MKTPRDILFAQYKSAEPKLDAIRREVVAGLNCKDIETASFLSGLVSWCLGGLNNLWCELIFPCRRIWASLAAIWILLFIFDFSQRDKSELMAKNISPSPQLILTSRQQEKLLAELFDQSEPRVAEPPKIFSPKPRTEILKLLTA